MPAESIRRRLAAIVVVDVVGYSRLMEIDEAKTLAGLKKLQQLAIEPAVHRNGGRVIKISGDGFLIEFPSAVSAVTSALEMQQETAGTDLNILDGERLLMRIGVNLGDVVDEGSDVLGDGVNVAARLEAMASPGGICLSSKVYEEIAGKINATFFDGGTRRLKNLTRPVQVWHWPDALESTLPLPEKPSIAVLPFVSTSGNAEDESFVDGLTEDLITDLSRTSELFVIARNSVFVYKGKAVDARHVAQKLGVRYILEGSARRASGQLRINAQLIDTVGGQHLWAERFDRTIEDIFSLQDEVNGKIVEALVGRLTTPLPRKRPKNLEAHDLCLRARALTEESPQTAREAYLLLKRAVELEPSYAEATGMLAYNRWLAWTHFGEAENPNRRLAVELAKKAVELDPSDAGNYYFLGTILAYEKRWQDSEEAFSKALNVDPNHADTWAAMADVSVLSGRIEASHDQIQKAIRLNPYPACWYYCHLGQSQYAAGDYEGAVETLRREDTYRTNSRKFLAASLAQLGRLDEARREAELFLVAHPHFSISHWINSQPVRDRAVCDHIIDGFKKANLPYNGKSHSNLDIVSGFRTGKGETSDIADTSDLSIKVLGALRLETNGAEIELPPSKKTRALFAYLAILNKPVHRERLCEIFWEIPDDPRSALRWSLTKIRGMLGTHENVLWADRNTVHLRVWPNLDYASVIPLAKADLERLPIEELERAANLIDGDFLEDLSLDRCEEFQAWRRALSDEIEMLELRLLRELIIRLRSQPKEALRYASRLRLRSKDAYHDAEIEKLLKAARMPNSVVATPASSPPPETTAIIPTSVPALGEQDQEVRFCKARDGTRLAYATSGRGSPVLRAAHWMSHLTYDWDSPIWHHWISGLSKNHLFIRYDERCNGLSEREAADVSFEAMVSDLETVADAAGLERFTLLGVSQGCALSVAYAVRNPERVSGLILYGGYVKGWRARGDAREIATRQALATLMREGWGKSNALFRQLFSSMFIRGASAEHFTWMDELQRRTMLPDDAWRLQNAFADIDVSELLPLVDVPTLVLHAREDAVAPLESGKALAADIKGARFIELESPNHILLKNEPAFAEFMHHINAFIAATSDKVESDLLHGPTHSQVKSR